jgi:hypothetical protein
MKQSIYPTRELFCAARARVLGGSDQSCVPVCVLPRARHPTGRRVSFLNGYAIRGKYFNFSTVGQWMWDEIKVSVPPGTSIHPLLKGIYEATVKTTEADAKLAEAEWKRVTHEEGSPQSEKPFMQTTVRSASSDFECAKPKLEVQRTSPFVPLWASNRGRFYTLTLCKMHPGSWANRKQSHG